MARISLVRYRAVLAGILLALLSVGIARAQTACLIYSTVDPNTGCRGTGSSAAEAVNNVLACDAPLLCGSSSLTLDAVNDDPAIPGQPFTVTITYTASPAGPCGSSITQASTGGSITSGVGSQCPVPEYWVGVEPLSPESHPDNGVGDPVDPATGNVYITDVDVTFADGPMAFSRFYNSGDSVGADRVPGWRHSYDRSVVTIFAPRMSHYPTFSTLVSPKYSTPASACTSGFSAIQSSFAAWAGATATYSGNSCVIATAAKTLGVMPVRSNVTFVPPPTPMEYQVIRDNGQVLHFPVSGGVITNPTGVSLRLATTGSGFTLTDDDDNVEVYDSAGVLQSITSRAGVVQTLSYSSGLWSGVTDSFGNTLTVSRTAQGSISAITVNGGAATHYGYDILWRLTSVTNLDSTAKTHVYGDSRFVNAITSITDENSVTLQSWVYDAQKRATSTVRAGGAFAMTLVYNADGTVQTTDALGAVRTFGYAQVGDFHRPMSISGSQCPTCAEAAVTSYDSAGWVSSRTDYNGNLTCYANDAARGLELVRVEGFAPGSACPSSLATHTPASGTRQRAMSTTWHSTFRLPTSIVEANRTSTFSYDTTGNLLTRTVTDTTVTPNVSRTWSYTYDAYGRVLTVDGPRTDVVDVTTFTYYTCATGFACGHVHTVTDAAGHVTTYNTYNATGQPLTITDANGVVTTVAYDARLRVTAIQIGSETTTLSYDLTGLLHQVTRPDSSYLIYGYDAAHRLTQITDRSGNKITYTLDALGNRTAESAYDPSNVLRRTHTRVINTLSQIFQEVNAAGTAAVTTTYGYDSNGNPTSIEAPLGRNSGNAYDELNRVTQMTNAASGTTQFQYDAHDNLIAVIDPRSLTTSYNYDGFGDLTGQVSPDTGATTNTQDAAGNLATSTDARGVVASYAYDALNRVTSAAYTLGGTTDQTISFTYDTGTNGAGRLTGASDANHSMSWTYDALGRVAGKTHVLGAVSLPVSYGYASGNLASVTTPSGQTVSYGYNVNHQVVSVSVNGTTVLSSATYEPFGPIKGWTWGNGTTVSRSYDADGKVSQIADAGTKSYSYDDAFRVTGIADTASGASSWTYGYDALDRITSGADGTVTRGWSYDANGNRLAETGSAPSTYTVSGTSNRVSATTGALTRTYSYDAAGNTTGYSSVTATYDNAGRLKTLATGSLTETMIYNALGERIKTSGGAAGTVLYAYDERGHLLGEYDGGGNLVQETVWLGDIPVATLRTNGASVAIYYVHTDHLNTPRVVTRPSDNAQVWTWFSDPFGTDAANGNPAGVGAFGYNLRLPGQVFDGQAGLHYNYRRDYDPATGRYIESDPIGLLSGVNTYVYVGASPLRHTDPKGLATVVVYSRGTDGNPAGHMAVATTGAGLYSYGTPDPYGGSVTDYLSRQLAERAVELVILPDTTSEEEAAIRAAMIKNHKKDYSVINNNCAQAVSNAFTDANLLPRSEYGPPALPGWNFLNILSLPGAIYQYLPKGSAPPANLQSYDPVQLR